LAIVLTLPSCSGKASDLLADDAKRKELIETMVGNRDIRKEMIDRLVGPPTDRAVVIDRILEDEDAAGHLVQKILATDKGKALIASRVAADTEANTFVRMLMLTGVMGASMTQKQADAIGLGGVFTYGNQRRTMTDLKRLGEAVETWAREQGGHYPVCADFEEVDGCLAENVKSVGGKSLRAIDAWGNGYQYRSDGEGAEYILVSYANDGLYDELGKVGPTQSFDCDIVFSNGDFIQWPGLIRKTEIR
jgi:hypothetical protein